jgi:hypothetical protein
MLAVFWVKASWIVLDSWQQRASTTLKKENKIKSAMFLFLNVFGGVVGYEERSR